MNEKGLPTACADVREHLVERCLRAEWAHFRDWYAERGREAFRYFLILLVVCILFYGQALFRNFFWWDDITVLLDAQDGVDSLIRNHEGHFFPFFRLWMIGEWGLFGLYYPAYQLVSILLLTMTSFLLFWLLRRAGAASPTALFAAVVFIAAPATSENMIMWITTQSAILMMLCFLLALASLPDHEGAAVALVTLSFGFFGAGIWLVVPFCLYCALNCDRLRWRPIVWSLLAVALFLRAKADSGSALPPLTHSLIDVRTWFFSIVGGIHSLWIIFDPPWYVPFALCVSFALLLWPSHTQISASKALSLIFAASIVFGFFLMGYSYRGIVERRHLPMPLIGFLWVVVVGWGTRPPSYVRHTIAVVILALFVFYPLWVRGQYDIDVRWKASGKPTAQFTRELRGLLRTGRPLYDTHLIPAANPYHTLSEYTKLLGYDGYPFVQDTIVTTYRRLFDMRAELAQHQQLLASWLKANPDGPIREFYAKYYRLKALKVD